MIKTCCHESCQKLSCVVIWFICWVDPKEEAICPSHCVCHLPFLCYVWNVIDFQIIDPDDLHVCSTIHPTIETPCFDFLVSNTKLVLEKLYSNSQSILTGMVLLFLCNSWKTMVKNLELCRNLPLLFYLISLIFNYNSIS